MITKNANPNKPLPLREDGTSAPPKRIAPPRQACQYGQFSHTTLYKLIAEGKIDAYKRESRTLVDLDSIDRYHAAMPRIAPKGAG